MSGAGSTDVRGTEDLGNSGILNPGSGCGTRAKGNGNVARAPQAIHDDDFKKGVRDTRIALSTIVFIDIVALKL